MPSREKLSEFTAWCGKHITGDEKGQAQIFLDRLFQAFGQAGSLDTGGTAEFRIRKADEDGGGTAFADYVWKPVVLRGCVARCAENCRYPVGVDDPIDSCSQGSASRNLGLSAIAPLGQSERPARPSPLRRAEERRA